MCLDPPLGVCRAWLHFFFFFREYLKDNWFWDGCLEAARAEGIHEGRGEDQR